MSKELDDVLSYIDNIATDYSTSVPERGALGDAGSALVRGSGRSLGMIGAGMQALEYDQSPEEQSPLSKFGRWLEDKGQSIERRYRPDSGSANDSWLKRQTMSGLESLGPSVTPFITGIGAGALTGNPAFGAAVGAATLAESFYGGTYKQTMDQLAAQRPDLSYGERHNIANKVAGIETGGEYASDFIAMATGGLLGKAGSKAAFASLRDLIKTPLKQRAVNFATGFASELGTETAQNKLEGDILANAGIGEKQSLLNTAVNTAIPVLISFGVIHGGSTAVDIRRRAAMVKALNAPDPETRAEAALGASSLIEDPEVKQAWLDHASQQIKAGKPINTGMSSKEISKQVEALNKTADEKLNKTDENGFQTVDDVIDGTKDKELAKTIDDYMPSLDEIEISTEPITGTMEQSALRTARKRNKQGRIDHNQTAFLNETERQAYDQYQPELPEGTLEQTTQEQQAGQKKTTPEESSTEGAKVNADQTRTETGKPGQEDMAGQVPAPENNLSAGEKDKATKADTRDRVENIKGLDLNAVKKKEAQYSKSGDASTPAGSSSPGGEVSKQPWEMTKEEYYKNNKAKKRKIGVLKTEKSLFEKEKTFSEWGERVSEKYPTFGMTDKEVSDWAANIRKNRLKDYNDALASVKSKGKTGSETFMGVPVQTTEESLKKLKRDLNKSVKEADDLIKQHKIDKSLLYIDGEGWMNPDIVERHRKTVEQAISENKPVPPEVLADYPDLQKADSPHVKTVTTPGANPPGAASPDVSTQGAGPETAPATKQKPAHKEKTDGKRSQNEVREPEGNNNRDIISGNKSAKIFTHELEFEGKRYAKNYGFKTWKGALRRFGEKQGKSVEIEHNGKGLFEELHGDEKGNVIRRTPIQNVKVNNPDLYAKRVGELLSRGASRDESVSIAYLFDKDTVIEQGSYPEEKELSELEATNKEKKRYVWYKDDIFELIGTRGNKARIKEVRGEKRITVKKTELTNKDGSRKFSRTTTPTGTTVSEAQQEAKSFLGRKVYKRWAEDGTLKIIQGPKEATGIELKSKGGKISGHYNPTTGQIALIADNIKKGGVSGVLLHEATHKLLHADSRFQKDRAEILDSIAKDTSWAVKTARERAIEVEGKDADPDLIAEETLSYLMELKAGQKTSIIRRVIAAVRRALRRIGLPLGKYSHDELVQMFKAGIKKKSKGISETATAEVANNEKRYSIASDIKEKVAHPVSESESFNKFMHYVVDKNRSIEQIQKRLGGVKEELDLFMKETQRPKISAYLTEKFWSEHVQPFIEEAAKHKIEISEVEELAHALHATEANEALRNAKAKSYIDDILHSDIDKNLKNKLENAVFEAEKDPDNLPKGYRLALEKFLKQHGGEVEKIRDSWERFIEKPSGMTDQEAAEIVEKYKGNKKIHALVDRISAINEEKLYILHDAGLITDDEYNAYKNKYKHYVPLYREGFEGEASSGIGAGLQAPGKPIKARGGSSRGVVDIFANTVKNYETALIRAEKAKSMETLYKLVKNNPDPELWHIKEEKKAPYYDSWGNLREYPTQQLNKNEIRIKVDGKPYIIEVNRDDPTAMRMIETLRADAPSHGPIVNFLAKINRFLAAVNTSYAPEFILSNFIRDLPTGLINISEHNLSSYEMFKKVKQSMKTIAKVEMGKKVNKEEYDLYKRYKKAGGKISWMDVHETAQDLAKKIQAEYEYASGKRPVRSTVRKWNDLWQHLNTAVENAGRFAAFKLGVENGMSDAKAAQMAADLTVDFTKKGTMSPVLNSLYLFFNASVQGNYRILRALINSPKARKMVGGLAMMGFMAGMWNAASGGDDLEDYLKERNLVIKIPGSKKMVKIPLPYGFNFFVNAGYEAADMVTNKDYSPVKGAARLANVLAGSFNPIQAGTLLQTLAPTVLDPFVQVGENKTWFGGELMPAQDKYAKVKKPDSQRYWKSASAPSTWFASMMNEITGGNKVRSGLVDVSPETLDLVMDTMGGSAFRFVKDISLMPGRALNNELPMYKIPFVRRVMSEVPEYATSKKYYRLWEDLLTREAESKVYQDKFRLDAKEKRLLRVMKKTERKISKLRKKLRAVSDRKRKDILKGRIDALQKVVVGMAG